MNFLRFLKEYGLYADFKKAVSNNKNRIIDLLERYGTRVHYRGDGNLAKTAIDFICEREQCKEYYGYDNVYSWVTMTFFDWFHEEREGRYYWKSIYELFQLIPERNLTPCHRVWDEMFLLLHSQ